MEKEPTHQEENPKKSLEERVKEFEEGMEEEMKKGDIHLEKFKPAELAETFLLIYEGIKEGKLTPTEFIELRNKINNFMGWAADKVQNLQSAREKNI